MINQYILQPKIQRCEDGSFQFRTKGACDNQEGHDEIARTGRVVHSSLEHEYLRYKLSIRINKYILETKTEEGHRQQFQSLCTINVNKTVDDLFLVKHRKGTRTAAARTEQTAHKIVRRP